MCFHLIPGKEDMIQLFSSPKGPSLVCQPIGYTRGTLIVDSNPKMTAPARIGDYIMSFLFGNWGYFNLYGC